MKSNSTEKFEELQWIFSHIQGSNKPKKMIIYVRSINTCYIMFLWLVSSISENFFHSWNSSSQKQENALKNRRVEMFHANTDEASKTRILEDLSKQPESIQVLQLLLEWASIWQMLTLWYIGDYQILAWVTEVGRCARDGRPGYAICYAFIWSVMKCSDESLKRLVKLEIWFTVHCIKKNVILEGMGFQDMDILLQDILCFLVSYLSATDNKNQLTGEVNLH